ncbi:MAG: TrkH family potassium uptake protein [Candidatus Limivivens sp.]|nr:TrkH family potassium uptake protein [Candidatus Limivivens sp.]
MNYSMIAYMLGWVCCFAAGFMLLPILVAVIYRESSGYAFAAVAALCAVLGVLLILRKPKKRNLAAKDGLVIVALCWIVLSIFGAIPFTLSGEIPFFVDALFETISGFTTTGASILPEVEALSHACLFWRSFTHWVGGMGVLVFILAILPLKGGSSMFLMRAESPGPSVSKLVPRMRTTAMILYGIYFALTVVEIILLLLGGMPLFDTLCSAFGTAGTGGFGVRSDSFAGYSAYLQGVVAVFMVLFGVNFNLYYLCLQKKFKQALTSLELRAYLLIIALSTAVIAWTVIPKFGSVGQAFHQAFFQVSSIITTTGFATADFNQWPALAKTILVTLMFIGACAGSTGGGIKVSRILIMLKGVRKELALIAHPRSVRKVQIDGRTVEHDVVRSVNSFMAIYFVIFVASVLVVSLDEKDLVTNFTAVAATLNNIGPGLEVVGPVGNFSSFSVLSKFVLMFDMLAGRLELLPMLVLFVPSTWKGKINRKKA